MEFTIGFATNDELDAIANLSKKFERENCCNGIVADKKNYFTDKKVAIAKLDDAVVGYCYGEVEITDRNTSKYKKGQKCFYIEELYVGKQYRNNKIGQKLFLFMENYAKENGCDFIETTAVSKDYKRLLSFYIENLGMEFWSANVIKKL